MRRKDREIQSPEEITKIMKKSHVCTLAFSTDSCPYIIPMNFGFTQSANKYTLYFHGAQKGTKIDLMHTDNHISFCMYTEKELKLSTPACRSTMFYASICGTGFLTEVTTTEEKHQALTHLMHHYNPTAAAFDFDSHILTQTTVLKLEVQTLTAKTNTPHF